MSGLQINFDKSIFVPITLTIPGCPRGSFPINYLGLPLTIKRPKKIDYLPLITCTQNRLAGWKAHLLSIYGRRVLVSYVLTAISIY